MSEEELFEISQWWYQELDVIATTADQRRAMAVIRNMMNQLVLSRAELAALKAGQGEAVAWQYREIGEGGWSACDHEWYQYCEKSPEHDTRVVRVQPEPIAYAQANLVDIFSDSTIAVICRDADSSYTLPLYTAPPATGDAVSVPRGLLELSAKRLEARHLPEGKELRALLAQSNP